MAVIYKAINKINNKAYIGFAVNFNKRQNEHQKKAMRGDGSYFHAAIKKYGWDNFEWLILKEDATLDDEIDLIEEHNTFNSGYNLTKGGEGKLGYIVSEESRARMKIAHTGRKPTEKQLRVLRENAQKMKETGHSDDVKKKISNSHKGKIFTEQHKKNISINHAAKKETGAYYQSEEYKQKMKRALTGIKRTPEQKEKYRLAAIERWKKRKQL